jgi:hypothetical protein
MLDRAFTGRAPDRPPSPVLDTLAEAIPHLAATRTGALIAIRGREPWTSHIHGGIDLGGAVSAPLLYSIFHPETPGHDGAVLIEGDRVTRFAVHLPLASELPDVSRYGGTRHAAGLGLSQECDALVIIVSEERGTMSLAEGGRLSEVETAGALRQQLRRFLDRSDVEDAAGAAVPRRWLSGPPVRWALVSMLLATALWVVLGYSPDTVLRSFTVPIAVRNLPEDWVIADALPMDAQVELSGSERSFQELDAERLTISIDLSEPASGVREVVIGESNLALPSGITLRGARPAVLSMRLQPTRTVRVPVVVPTTGVLPEALERVSLRAEPETIAMIVPEDAADPEQVFTEVLDLRQIRGDVQMARPLAIPADSRLRSEEQSDVTIHVDVRERVEGR